RSSAGTPQPSSSPGCSPKPHDQVSAFGSPLGQGVFARFFRVVLGLLAAGPGCDLSEVAAVGIGPSALDCRVAPDCPPGPVLPLLARLSAGRLVSRSICL